MSMDPLEGHKDRPRDLGLEGYGRCEDRKSMAAGMVAAIEVRQADLVADSSCQSSFARPRKEKPLCVVEEEVEFREILVPRHCWAHSPNLTGRCVGG